MKRIKNQAGITLIELLAALVIGTIVIGLAGSVLVSTFTQADVTSDHANLRQEANIVLTKIRSDYTDPDASTTLSFDDTENMLFDRNNAPLSEEDFFKFSSFTFTEVRPNGEVANSLSYTEDHSPSPAEVTFEKGTENRGNRLKVEFTIEDTNGRSFSVDTTIARLGDYEDYVQGNELSESQAFNFFRDNDIFLYTNNLTMSNKNGISDSIMDSSAIIINNDNSRDLRFVRDNFNIEASYIQINKNGNSVIFEQATVVGSQQTDSVILKGDIDIMSDDVSFFGNAIYIDGNVNFNESGQIGDRDTDLIVIRGNIAFDSDSSLLNAKNIHIEGDVHFSQNSTIGDSATEQIIINGDVTTETGVNNEPALNAEEIFIHPSLNQNDFSINGKLFSDVQAINNIPDIITPPTLSLRDDSWFEDSGYMTDISSIESDQKYFLDNHYSTITQSQSANNVVIVSNRDVTITDSWQGHSLEGIIIAINGQVELRGQLNFQGIIISEDGIELPNNATSLIYKDTLQLFQGDSDFPLQ